MQMIHVLHLDAPRGSAVAANVSVNSELRTTDMTEIGVGLQPANVFNSLVTRVISSRTGPLLVSSEMGHVRWSNWLHGLRRRKQLSEKEWGNDWKPWTTAIWWFTLRTLLIYELSPPMIPALMPSALAWIRSHPVDLYVRYRRAHYWFIFVNELTQRPLMPS
jgi:hypothetical protein